MLRTRTNFIENCIRISLFSHNKLIYFYIMLTVDKIENKYIVSFYNVSKFNVLNSKEIESRLLPLVSQKDSNLTLNFSGIRFIDSTGFEVLMNILKTSRKSNSCFSLINLSEDLMELMELVNLDTVFQLN